MSYFICDGCDKKHFIFREGGGERLARESGIAFLGAIPLDTSVPIGSDEGQPQVVAKPESSSGAAYTDAAGTLARQVSILNAQNDGALEQFTLTWKPL